MIMNNSVGGKRMLHIYCDGAFNPTTLEGGGCFIVQSQTQNVRTFYRQTIRDNQSIEFEAIVEALHFIIDESLHIETTIFYTDNKLVYSAIEKNYAKNSHYQHYLNQINQLVAQCAMVFFKWIPEKENKGADFYAKQALRLKK